MRGWDDILEFALEAWLTWKKRDDKGGYCDRFPQSSEFAKFSPIYVYGDSVMSKFTTSPVFTDGFHVFVHESVVESMLSPSDDFAGLMKPIFQGLEAAIYVGKNIDAPDDDIAEEFPNIDTVEYFGFWKALKSTEEGRGWIVKMGLPDLAETTKVSAWSTFRKVSLEQMQKDSSGWISDAEKILKDGWESCGDIWANEKKASPRGRLVKMSLARLMGEKLGRARNAIAAGEGEMEVLDETWGSALTNWGNVLRQMLVRRDTVNFGRSILAFVGTCQTSSALSFEEKTDITNVVAPVLDDMPFKMTWVDILSGSYEFWPFNKIVRTEIERDVALLEGEIDLPETMAFYYQMPSIGPASEMRCDFLNAALTSMFDVIDPDAGAEDAAKEAFHVTHDIAKYISQEDALSILENWKEWSDGSCPGVFSESDDESFDAKATPSQIISDFFKKMIRSRKWTPKGKEELQKLFFE